MTVDIIQIQKNSKKFDKYINNLDKLLGVTTVISPAARGLRLTKDKRLLIDNQHDWYIYDKDPNELIFTIVGIINNSAIAYLLGNRNGSSPFLGKLDTLSLGIDSWNQRVVQKSDRAKRWPLSKSLKIGGFSLAGIAGLGAIVLGMRWITQNQEATLGALIGVLPFIFVAIILLGAVAWIGGQGG